MRIQALAGLALYLVSLVWGVFVFHFRVDSSTTTSLPTAPPTTTPSSNATTRHVLLALNGNHSGMLDEFEVALKSVLWNAPLDDPLAIHVMADRAATEALRVRSLEWNIHNFALRNPTSLTVYNVEPLHEIFRSLIDARFSRVLSSSQKETTVSYKHSLGTYYRLFPQYILPKEADPVVYLDTDVVVLSNMDELWRNLYDQEALFQWGEGKCAGFMVLRPSKMEQLWEVFQNSVTMAHIKKVRAGKSKTVDDQIFFRAIDKATKQVEELQDKVKVGFLPPRWQVSFRNGPWADRREGLQETGRIMKTKGASMLHFNGGAESVQAYFRQHPALVENWPVWSLAKYYVELPWAWVPQTLKTRVRWQNEHEVSYPLVLRFKTVEEADASSGTSN